MIDFCDIDGDQLSSGDNGDLILIHQQWEKIELSMKSPTFILPFSASKRSIHHFDEEYTIHWKLSASRQVFINGFLTKFFCDDKHYLFLKTVESFWLWHFPMQQIIHTYEFALTTASAISLDHITESFVYTILIIWAYMVVENWSNNWNNVHHSFH